MRVAIPMAPADRPTFRHAIRMEAELVCVAEPRMFSAVPQWHENFTQFTDQDVRAVLEQAAPDTARCLNAKAFERRYAGDEFRRNRTDRRQGYSHPRRQPARAAGECRSRHGFFG